VLAKARVLPEKNCASYSTNDDVTFINASRVLAYDVSTIALL